MTLNAMTKPDNTHQLQIIPRLRITYPADSATVCSSRVPQKRKMSSRRKRPFSPDNFTASG